MKAHKLIYDTNLSVDALNLCDYVYSRLLYFICYMLLLFIFIATIETLWLFYKKHRMSGQLDWKKARLDVIERVLKVWTALDLQVQHNPQDKVGCPRGRKRKKVLIKKYMGTP